MPLDMCGKMASKSEKLKLLIEGLSESSKYGFIISRKDLRKLIVWKLDYSDVHTINSWLDKLLLKGFISLKDSREKDKKSTNKTLYRLNIDDIERFLTNERFKANQN